MIPYGHQSISKADIDAVVRVLETDWLTQGPTVGEFERELANRVGSKHCVAVSNGTAALHTAYFAAGLQSGDEFITSPLTFAATANAGVWQGARPVFVDIDPQTGNIDPQLIPAHITSKTKVIVPVDYMGRPSDLDSVKEIAAQHNLMVVEDACQALGAKYNGRLIGSISDYSVFSFHPVKSITTGEGGAITTSDETVYKKMKMFSSHGITRENMDSTTQGAWYYEMQTLGLNYRLTDFQSALGISQLARLESMIQKRRDLAARYTKALSDIPELLLPPQDDTAYQSSWHLYVIRLRDDLISRRAEVFAALRESGIGVQVHHIPVHLHPYYRRLGYKPGTCPEAEKWYESALSLPLYPDLKQTDQDFVIAAVRSIIGNL